MSSTCIIPQECSPSKNGKQTHGSESPVAPQSRSPSPHISPVSSPVTGTSSATPTETSISESSGKNCRYHPGLMNEEPIYVIGS